MFLKESGSNSQVICEGFQYPEPSSTGCWLLQDRSIIIHNGGDRLRTPWEYGYRRIHVLSKREGIKARITRRPRIYPQLSLQKQSKLEKASGAGNLYISPLQSIRPMYGPLTFLGVVPRGKSAGLAAIDDFTRLVVGISVDFSIPASRVLWVIEKSKVLYSRPRIFRTDNGSEFSRGT